MLFMISRSGIKVGIQNEEIDKWANLINDFIKQFFKENIIDKTIKISTVMQIN